MSAASRKSSNEAHSGNEEEEDEESGEENYIMRSNLNSTDVESDPLVLAAMRDGRMRS